MPKRRLLNSSDISIFHHCDGADYRSNCCQTCKENRHRHRRLQPETQYSSPEHDADTARLQDTKAGVTTSNARVQRTTQSPSRLQPIFTLSISHWGRHDIITHNGAWKSLREEEPSSMRNLAAAMAVDRPECCLGSPRTKGAKLWPMRCGTHLERVRSPAATPMSATQGKPIAAVRIRYTCGRAQHETLKNFRDRLRAIDIWQRRCWRGETGQTTGTQEAINTPSRHCGPPAPSQYGFAPELGREKG